MRKICWSLQAHFCALYFPAAFGYDGVVRLTGRNHRAANGPLCYLAGLLLALVPPAFATAQDPAFAPFEKGERLIYRLFWPSGLPLGEAVFDASPRGSELHLRVALEASLPQYRFNATFSSVATRDGLCSLQFHQKVEEGSQISEESMEFDQAARRVRLIRGPHTAADPAPECARDPLTFLYYARSRMAAGLPVEAESMSYGKNFAVRLATGGNATIELGGTSRRGDKLAIHFPARGQERTVEIWVASDAARTPLRFIVPTTLAVFRGELE